MAIVGIQFRRLLARALVVTIVLFPLKRDSSLIWRGDTPLVFGGERRMPLELWSHLSYTRLCSASLCNANVLAGKEVVLSSAEAFLCSREAGEKEKESARGTMGRGKTAPAFSLFPSSPTRFLFFDYWYFYRDTQWEPLRRREQVDKVLSRG